MTALFLWGERKRRNIGRNRRRGLKKKRKKSIWRVSTLFSYGRIQRKGILTTKLLPSAARRPSFTQIIIPPFFRFFLQLKKNSKQKNFCISLWCFGHSFQCICIVYTEYNTYLYIWRKTTRKPQLHIRTRYLKNKTTTCAPLGQAFENIKYTTRPGVGWLCWLVNWLDWLVFKLTKKGPTHANELNYVTIDNNNNVVYCMYVLLHM